MKKLYVYADFDWLKEMELIGELGYESLRGADSYSFTFNNRSEERRVGKECRSRWSPYH